MKYMKHHVSSLACSALALLTFISCSADDPPRDAIEMELAVTVALGQFDVERGQLMSSTVNVVIDGNFYPLEPAEESQFIDFENLTRMDLGGRRALVAGEISDGAYKATYAKLLPEKTAEVDDEMASVIAQMSDLERELVELQLEIFKLSPADEVMQASLIARIDVTQARINQLKKEYEMMLAR